MRARFGPRAAGGERSLLLGPGACAGLAAAGRSGGAAASIGRLLWRNDASQPEELLCPSTPPPLCHSLPARPLAHCSVLQVVRQIKAHPTGPEAFIPQALSNMVWACAHLRNGTRGCGGPSPGGGPPTTVRKDNRPGWAPAPAFLEAVAHVAALRMQDFQSQVGRGVGWGGVVCSGACLGGCERMRQGRAVVTFVGGGCEAGCPPTLLPACLPTHPLTQHPPLP